MRVLATDLHLSGFHISSRGLHYTYVCKVRVASPYHIWKKRYLGNHIITKLEMPYGYHQRPNKSNVDKFLSTFGVTTERFEITNHDIWDITHIAICMCIELASKDPYTQNLSSL